MNSNLCLNFAFKFAEYKVMGNDQLTSFILAGNYFKKQITAIIISKNKESAKRSYIFSDNTKCTYDMEGDFFKFKP